MTEFSFNDVLSALTHIRGGIPSQRLTSRIRLGEHRSLFFGPSNDMFDIQEYDPERDQPNAIVDIGDDEVLYARRCIEPHEIKINFLVDLSRSIDAGTNFSKRRMLLEAIGFIGATAVRYQDPIGIVGFTDKIVLSMSPKSGVNNFYHMLKVTYDLLDQDYSNKEIPQTDFFVALDFVRRFMNRPCFIPVISDFVDFEKIADSSLLRTVASKHEMIFVFLDNPMEFSNAKGLGYLRIGSLEGGRQIEVSRRKLPELEKEIRAKRRELRDNLRKMGVESVVLEYGKHFNRLFRFFERRRKERLSR